MIVLDYFSARIVSLSSSDIHCALYCIDVTLSTLMIDLVLDYFSSWLVSLSNSDVHCALFRIVILSNTNDKFRFILQHN